MAREFHRSDRVSEQLQRSLSEIIQSKLDDPRLKLVTITEVKVTRDLSHARVFFSSFADVDHKDVTRALEKAGGFLRGELGRMLVLRVVPNLHFEYDETLEQGQRLRTLIDNAVADDRQRHINDENE